MEGLLHKLRNPARRKKSWFPWPGLSRQEAVPPAAVAAPRKPRLGLVLSSGGAKGLAHIGVIQVLEENGIEIAAISGTSMGAYIAGLWAAGYSGRKLEELAASVNTGRDMFSLLAPKFPPRRGFTQSVRIEERLRESLGDMTFADLRVPAYLVATELNSYARRVFHSGDVVSAILASTAIPGVFVPYTRDGVEYIDGGVAEPLPVESLTEAETLDGVIAVSVLPTPDELKIARAMRPTVDSLPWWKRPLFKLNQHVNYFAPGNLIDILRGAAMGSQMRLVERASRHANVLLRPVVANPKWHDYNNHASYIRVGRETAERELPRLLDLAGLGCPIPEGKMAMEKGGVL